MENGQYVVSNQASIQGFISEEGGSIGGVGRQSTGTLTINVRCKPTRIELVSSQRLPDYNSMLVIRLNYWQTNYTFLENES